MRATVPAATTSLSRRSRAAVGRRRPRRRPGPPCRPGRPGRRAGGRCARSPPGPSPPRRAPATSSVAPNEAPRAQAATAVASPGSGWAVRGTRWTSSSARIRSAAAPGAARRSASSARRRSPSRSPAGLAALGRGRRWRDRAAAEDLAGPALLEDDRREHPGQRSRARRPQDVGRRPPRRPGGRTRGRRSRAARPGSVSDQPSHVAAAPRARPAAGPGASVSISRPAGGDPCRACHCGERAAQDARARSSGRSAAPG